MKQRKLCLPHIGIKRIETKSEKKKTKQTNKKKNGGHGRQTQACAASTLPLTKHSLHKVGVLGSIPGDCWPFHLCLKTSFRLQSKLLDLVYDGTILVPGSQ